MTNVRFEPADAEALPFPDSSFDIVTCRVAPHHFGDVRQFVREVARVLRVGGRFVLVDNVAPSDEALDQWINAVEVLRDPTHAREYTVEEWRTFAQDAGLSVKSVSTWTKAMEFGDWCERAQVPDAARDELRERFLRSTPEARRAFEIVIEGTEVRSFALHTMMLVATR